jgi:hypothetical protein
VLKSLVMLMAAGVKVNTDEIVPVIIDPDHAAADLTRTVTMIQNYERVRSKINFNAATDNMFFNTKINREIVPALTMPIGNTRDIDFKTYIGLSEMSDNGNYNANHALALMLFSQKNLDSRMDVGFKGNPNVGSVVLNQFADSKEFKDIAASFGQHDRIFIISSIFGGTGASGFPLLLKNIRSISGGVPGMANVRQAPIGAVSVLPYFGVAPDEDSQINSSTFISKTRAALSYYDRNMHEANALYYIADDKTNQYRNSEGGTMQENAAHFIELAAALAIVDFAAIPDDELITGLVNDRGVPKNTVYKEFGIKNEDPGEEIIFSDLSLHTQLTLKKPMTQFALFCKYQKEQIEASLRQPWARDHGYDGNFLRTPFYQAVTSTVDAYWKWLTEMNGNRRAFAPICLEKGQIHSLIKGAKPATTLWGRVDYANFDGALNDRQGHLAQDASIEHRFIELFNKATARLTEKYYNI